MKKALWLREYPANLHNLRCIFHTRIFRVNFSRENWAYVSLRCKNKNWFLASIILWENEASLFGLLLNRKFMGTWRGRRYSNFRLVWSSYTIEIRSHYLINPLSLKIQVFCTVILLCFFVQFVNRTSNLKENHHFIHITNTRISLYKYIYNETQIAQICLVHIGSKKTDRWRVGCAYVSAMSVHFFMKLHYVRSTVHYISYHWFHSHRIRICKLPAKTLIFPEKNCVFQIDFLFFNIQQRLIKESEYKTRRHIRLFQ